MNTTTNRKTDKEMVEKIGSFDKRTLRAMLYSIKDRSLLQELIEIGDNFSNAIIIANKTDCVMAAKKHGDCKCENKCIKIGH